MTVAKTKRVIVNRKFLTDLANQIYDTKTRRFLRLCSGKLQNGPDPTNARRPMHCGLGELYFAMTGQQPETKFIGEEDVVALAVELSTFPQGKAMRAIKELDISGSTKERLLCELDGDDELSEQTLAFRQVLDEIPNTNDNAADDSNCRSGKCSFEAYRRRSSKVARDLRNAAKLLPD